MASCDAADVQVKMFSPAFRRARETRASDNDRFCQAERNGDLRCPEGYCRCSGELRKKVETRDHPWGAPESTPAVCKPPPMTQAELAAAHKAAQDKRAALRAELAPALQALIEKARAKDGVLAPDEAERIAELEEWLAAL